MKRKKIIRRFSDLRKSIAARAFMATFVAIVFSMSVAGYAVYTAFERNTDDELRERLRSNLNMMLSAVLSRGIAIDMPEPLPEPRLSTLGSGLYAFIEDGNRNVVWNSRSALLGQIDRVPPPPEVGQQVFTSSPVITLANQEASSDLYAMAITILWDYGDDVVEPYTFWVLEEKSIYQDKLNSFLTRLSFWLGLGAVAMLVIQILLWWWVYRPLKHLAKEIRNIEKGKQSLLSDKHPLELYPVVDNLNALLDFQHRRISRSRNTLQDLAHSLKTPLAVLSNTVASQSSAEEITEVVNTQVHQMNQTVSYQLQKAATAGQSALLSPLEVEPFVNKIINTLKKVYADKQLQYDIDVEAGLTLRIDEGDLYEVLGNILDNASKWAQSQVRIVAASSDRLIRITVEDDGPGVSDEAKQFVLDRGKRADQSVPGHGVGMAIVRDIIEEGYQGSLYIYDAHIGGARIVIDIPHAYRKKN